MDSRYEQNFMKTSSNTYALWLLGLILEIKCGEINAKKKRCQNFPFGGGRYRLVVLSVGSGAQILELLHL